MHALLASVNRSKIVIVHLIRFRTIERRTQISGPLPVYGILKILLPVRINIKVFSDMNFAVATLNLIFAFWLENA